MHQNTLIYPIFTKKNNKKEEYQLDMHRSSHSFCYNSQLKWHLHADEPVGEMGAEREIPAWGGFKADAGPAEQGKVPPGARSAPAESWPGRRTSAPQSLGTGSPNNPKGFPGGFFLEPPGKSQHFDSGLAEPGAETRGNPSGLRAYDTLVLSLATNLSDSLWQAALGHLP